jgi:hypothetical protein
MECDDQAILFRFYHISIDSHNTAERDLLVRRPDGNAVNGHTSGPNQIFGFPPGGESTLRQELVQADRLS